MLQIQCRCCDARQHAHCYGFALEEPREPHFCYQCLVPNNDRSRLGKLKSLARFRRALWIAYKEGYPQSETAFAQALRLSCLYLKWKSMLKKEIRIWLERYSINHPKDERWRLYCSRWQERIYPGAFLRTSQDQGPRIFQSNDVNQDICRSRTEEMLFPVYEVCLTSVYNTVHTMGDGRRRWLEQCNKRVNQRASALARVAEKEGMCLSGGWLNTCPKSVLLRHGGTMVKEGTLPARVSRCI